jgi:hypothetical protein
MFVLRSNIKIGAFKNVKPAEVKISKSMMSYVDRATIKVPITARIKRADETITATAETAKLFTEGDAVSIDLGYNDKLNNEFIGFVSRVNFTTPVEIECEGYSFILRKRSYLKTFKEASLKSILQYLVDGTEITLSPLIPDLKITKWVINQQSGTEVLEQLKKELLVSIFFTGKELYAGLQYLQPKATTKYRLGWNVIKDGNLKLREAKNQDVIIKYIGEKKTGEKVEVRGGRLKDAVVKVNANSGTIGETQVIKSHTVTDQATLQAMADKKHSDLTYDGYEGKLTTFLLPYCEPGYKANVDDTKYTERSGNYIIESVETSYSTSGARRSVGIGKKL